jgi:hypothetical protein
MVLDRCIVRSIEDSDRHCIDDQAVLGQRLLSAH